MILRAHTCHPREYLVLCIDTDMSSIGREISNGTKYERMGIGNIMLVGVMEILFLSIKNMVCHRCVLAVQNLLDKQAIPYHQVKAGEVQLVRNLVPEERDQLTAVLSSIGLELMRDKSKVMAERIKELVIRKARAEVDTKENKLKLSTYLSQNLFYEYTYLSSHFSSVEGCTIESYFIRQRIEKVKELISYNELTLSAISDIMQYSSVAHLSYQFKQITGVTPTNFKKSGLLHRKLIDQV